MWDDNRGKGQGAGAMNKELPPEGVTVWRTYAGFRQLAYHRREIWYNIPYGYSLGILECVDSWESATEDEIEAAWKPIDNRKL